MIRTLTCGRVSRRVIGLGAVVLSLAFLSGCVPYKKYKTMEDELSRAERANEDLTRRLNQYAMRIKDLSQQATGGGVAQSEYDRVLAQVVDLRQQLKDRGGNFKPADLRELESRGITGVVLDPSGGLAIGDYLLFSSGEANLKKAQLPVLDGIASMLRSKYPQNTFIIEGNTDNEPLQKTRGMYEDNLNLGYQRARAVYKYLKGQHSFAEDQFRLVTCGFTNPTNPSDVDSKDARAKNRRVVIRRFTGGNGKLASN